MRKSPVILFCNLVVYAFSKDNILLIMSDDLGQVIPPYIDARHPLGSKSLAPRFHQFLDQATAFNGITSFPVCGPSRASSLTGRLPDRLKIYNFERFIDQAAPGIYSIFGYFKNVHQYETFVAGKIFHQDAHHGMQLAHLTGQLSTPAIMYNGANSECSQQKLWCSINPQHSSDAKVVNSAKKFFKKMHKIPDKPWIAGIGLHRPHLQISYIKYMRKNVQGDLPIYSTPQIPGTIDFEHSLAFRDDTETTNGFKALFGRKWQFLTNKGLRKNSYTLFSGKYDQTLKEVRAAYYAGSRSVMINIGKILDSLDTNGFANNTHVVFYSDHGWQNGERRMIGKNGLGSAATNIPLIIHRAGQKKGYINQNPASPIDIFPTLIELTYGKQAVTNYADPSTLPLDGKSLVPGIYNPQVAVNEFVISQYPRCQAVGTVQTNDCMTAPNNNEIKCDAGGGRPKITYMGYLAVFANGNRYVEWREFKEERTVCARSSWETLPRSIKHWGPAVWQINPARTCTNWQRPAIQQELYYSGNEYSTNLAFSPKPADKKLIEQYSKQIRQKLERHSCQL